MYFVFDPVKRGGLLFPHPDLARFSEEASKRWPVSLRCEDWPGHFWQETDPGTGETEWRHDLWIGWEVVPRYSFDPERYRAGEDPFVSFDAHDGDWLRLAIRRHAIAREVRARIRPEHEIKRLREMVAALIEVVGRDKLPEALLAEWDRYQREIEGCKAKCPKTREWLDTVDTVQEAHGKTDPAYERVWR